jgi:hypothetical protein
MLPCIVESSNIFLVRECLWYDFLVQRTIKYCIICFSKYVHITEPITVHCTGIGSIMYFLFPVLGTILLLCREKF